MANPRLKPKVERTLTVIRKDIELKTNSFILENSKKSLVDKTWWLIHNQILEYESKKNLTNDHVKFNIQTFKRSKAIRVFVSSTFTDFFNEREHLVKVVFPELREWCFNRNLDLVECDLRWGVPVDSTSEDTILTCLTELDRSLEENDGQPFFVGLLGEKYGWVPNYDSLSDNLKNQYEWVPNISITHMEFLHGAFRCRNKNACFFVRDNLKNIPEEYRDKFFENNNESKLQLEALKEKLKVYHPEQVFEYSCDFAGIDETTGRKKVKLENLQNFGLKVLEFMKKSIENSYPDLKPIFGDQIFDFEPSEIQNQKIDIFLQEEKKAQDLFIVDRANFFIGYENELEQMVRNLNDENIGSFLIHGLHGSGKTSFMAMILKQIIEQEQNNFIIFYHFFDSSSYSQFTRTFICRFIDQFSKLLNLGDDFKFEIAYDVPETFETFTKVLDELKSNNKKVYLFIDGYEFSNQDYYKDWYSLCLNYSNIKLILTLDTSEMNEANFSSFNKICLNGFYNQTSELFIQKYLKNYNKRLDEKQMKLIMEKSNDNKTPLWLSYICNELRVFGEFTTINKKIQNLPFDILSLIKSIIQRINLDFPKNIINQLLCLISLSRKGIPENEICMLLNSAGFSTNRLEWAQINRSLKIFLRFEYFQSSQLVSIRNKQVKKVINEMLLNETESINDHHNKLINFFLNLSKYRAYSCFELCYHYKITYNKKNLAELLKSKEGFTYINASYRAFLLNEMRCKALPIKNENNHLRICNTCANRIGDLSYMSANKNSCFICGSFFVNNTKLAYKCHKHMFKDNIQSASNMFKCCICHKINFLSIHKNLNFDAYLCNFCPTMFCCMLEFDY